MDFLRGVCLHTKLLMLTSGKLRHHLQVNPEGVDADTFEIIPKIKKKKKKRLMDYSGENKPETETGVSC